MARELLDLTESLVWGLDFGVDLTESLVIDLLDESQAGFFCFVGNCNIVFLGKSGVPPEVEGPSTLLCVMAFE